MLLPSLTVSDSESEAELQSQLNLARSAGTQSASESFENFFEALECRTWCPAERTPDG
jgi:hypothetical protein